MPSFTGKYEYLAPGGSVVQQGSAEFAFDAEACSISGSGTPLAFDLGDVDVFEANDYDLRLVLYTGHVVHLKQFGKSFQDLRRELLEACRDRLVKCLLVSDLDEVARYAGRVSLESSGRACEGAAEIRLYESNLAVLPDAGTGFQWRLAEIDAVEFDASEYAVVVRHGDERLRVGRLAKRTGELAERLRQRTALLAERSARALHALFPFLSAEQFRQVAARMREGAATPIVDLRGVHRLLEPALLEQTVDAALRPYLASLVARASADGWYAGFKIVRKQETDQADSIADTTDASSGEEADVAAESEANGVPLQPDEGSQTEAPAAIEVGEGLEVLFWFLVPVAPRGGRASHAAWEASSSGGRATYVFRLPADGDARAGIAQLNAGLAAVNFRREPVYLPDDRLQRDIRYRHYAIATRRVPELGVVRSAFAGRALHRTVPSWRKQLDALLAR